MITAMLQTTPLGGNTSVNVEGDTANRQGVLWHWVPTPWCGPLDTAGVVGTYAIWQQHCGRKSFAHLNGTDDDQMGE